MKFSLWALGAVPALGQFLDIPDDNRMVQEGGVLRYPIRVTQGAAAVKNITKRQDASGLTSQKTGYFYTIDVTLGTPGQIVSVNFDTGSSELWVNPVCSKSGDAEFCQSFGRFSSSSTFVNLHKKGEVVYGTGYVDFTYGYDYAAIGSAKISQQIFGVAYDSEDSEVGIMGAGPDLYGWENSYPLIIDNLASQGFINSRAFSLDLRSLESTRGSVVYGGIDTRKYSGSLAKRPIIPAAESPDGYTRYWVYLDGIALTQDDGSKSPIFHEVNGQPVLLDSGYTVSALPGPIFNKLVKAFPSARPYPGSDLYEVDCSVGNLDGTVDFTFGDVVISVPFNDFLWHQPEFGVCFLGAFRDDEFPVLGDTFLRAAYVVYDWDNRNIHLASSDDCGSKLVAIGSGPGAVPSLVGECSAGSTTSSTEVPSSTESTAISTTESATTTAEPTTAESTTSEFESTETLPTISSTRYYNTSTTAPPSSITGITTAPTTITSTITTSKIYTITSCPPEVTNCPVGSVTTEVITSYTTYCPGNTGAPKPPSSITKTFTTTRTYTITDCPGTGSCHKGELTTEVLTKTTEVCAQSTATYTMTQTIYCQKGMSDCEEGQTKTTQCTVTIEPVPTYAHPQPIPGCHECSPVPPAETTHVVLTKTNTKVFTPTHKNPTGSVATMTQSPGGCTGADCSIPPIETSPPVVTAGAGGLAAPSLISIVLGALFAAVF